MIQAVSSSAHAPLKIVFATEPLLVIAAILRSLICSFFSRDATILMLPSVKTVHDHAEPACYRHNAMAALSHLVERIILEFFRVTIVTIFASLIAMLYS